MQNKYSLDDACARTTMDLPWPMGVTSHHESSRLWLSKNRSRDWIGSREIWPTRETGIIPRFGVAYSGQVKNSGMSSRTSPLTSCEAERYALPMSLGMMIVISNAYKASPPNPHEQSIWKIPIPTLWGRINQQVQSLRRNMHTCRVLNMLVYGAMRIK